jgi:hypothetical protein
MATIEPWACCHLSYGDVFWGPQLSADGSTILYTKVVNRSEDLMMIENFR